MSNQHVLFSHDLSQSVNLTDSEAVALHHDLDWIESRGPVNFNGDQAYDITVTGRGFSEDPAVLVSILHEDFADVLAATHLAIQPKVRNKRSDPVDTSESDLMATILSIFPDAEMDMDNEGQIVIYTGLVAIPGRQDLRGRFSKPQPSLPPVPDGFVRLMVLDDGETFSGLDGCSVFDKALDLDYDIETLFDEDPRPEGLDFVASFDDTGVQV